MHRRCLIGTNGQLPARLISRANSDTVHRFMAVHEEPLQVPGLLPHSFTAPVIADT